MKKLLYLFLLVLIAACVPAHAQGTKVKDFPTTTTGSSGDFLIKDDAAGIPGSTKKISVGNFISTYSISTSGSNYGWATGGNTGLTGANNIFGTLDATPVVFRTNNVGVMKLNTDGSLGIGYTSLPTNALLTVNGNVGIGTNSPTVPLQVNGSSHAADSSGTTNHALFMLDPPSKGGLAMGVLGGGSWIQSYSTPLTDLSGKTGLFLNPIGGGVVVGNIHGSYDAGAQLTVVGAGTTSSTATFQLQDSNKNPYLTALDNQRVGIGNSAPSYKLDVTGTLAGDTLYGTLWYDKAGNKIAFVNGSAHYLYDQASNKTIDLAGVLTYTTGGTSVDWQSATLHTGSGVKLDWSSQTLSGNWALGTPASGTLTNCTGLPATGVKQSVTILSPSSTGTVTLTTGNLNVIKPSGTASTEETIAMPASPSDGDQVEVVFFTTIVTVTWNGNGNTMGDQPPATTQNNKYRFTFNAGDTTWY